MRKWNYKKEEHKMLNRVIVMGRLTADPELTMTPSGISVCNIRLAVDRDSTSRESGTRQADFFAVVGWRGLADFMETYLSKGQRIVVEGRLQSSSWKNKEGEARSIVRVVANNIYFADSKRAATTQTNGTTPELAEGEDPPMPEETYDGGEEGDLPF